MPFLMHSVNPSFIPILPPKISLHHLKDHPPASHLKELVHTLPRDRRYAHRPHVGIELFQNKRQRPTAWDGARKDWVGQTGVNRQYIQQGKY